MDKGLRDAIYNVLDATTAIHRQQQLGTLTCSRNAPDAYEALANLRLAAVYLNDEMKAYAA